MTVIITDTGFASDDFTAPFLDLDAAKDAATASNEKLAIDLPSTVDPQDLADLLDRVAVIRVDFPSFSDGRGFTIARRLRLMGFTGRLRARGHVISDQYSMARRTGFDEVEISDDLAARQPEGEWLARANYGDHCYQNRLRGAS